MTDLEQTANQLLTETIAPTPDRAVIAGLLRQLTDFDDTVTVATHITRHIAQHVTDIPRVTGTDRYLASTADLYARALLRTATSRPAAIPAMLEDLPPVRLSAVVIALLNHWRAGDPPTHALQRRTKPSQSDFSADPGYSGHRGPENPSGPRAA